MSRVIAQAGWQPLLSDGAARLLADQAETEAPSLIPREDAAPPGFDDWEAEVAAPTVPDDPAVWEAARAAKAMLAQHTPVDTWPDWGDLSAHLPDSASFLPAIDDPEGYARLRRLFLRALREGSVPDEEVVDVAGWSEGVQDYAKAAVYRAVLEDMGCETDERMERAELFEDSRVYVDLEETPEEEDELSEALAHVGTLTSTRYDPFLVYQREAQRHRLLSAEEEVEIGQAMEASLEAALDALAAWPEGIARLLGAVKATQSGALRMLRLRTSPRQDPPSLQDSHEATDAAFAIDAPGEEPANDAEEDAGTKSEPPDADFFAAAELLSAIAIDQARDSPAWSEARGLLASMRVASGFLLELADEAMLDKSVAACDFKQAMAIHRLARDRMAIGNLKLVMFHAKKYMHFGQPLADLVQEGNIGLLRAVDKFDWRRGYRFSTFATWWVRQGISRFVADKCRTVRLPVHVFVQVQRLIRESEAFEERTGRPAEPREVAAALNLDERKAAALARIALEPMTLEDFDIHERMDPSMSHELIDRDPIEPVAERELEGAIDNALKVLPPKDERIIRQRFGLGGLAESTLEEISLSIGVTRERVRQIEYKALEKLRHPTRARLLDPSRVRSRAVVAEAAGRESGNREQANPIEDLLGAGPLRMVPIAVNKVLRLAESMRAAVDDDRLGSTGKIWVRVDDEEDNHVQVLIPMLVGLGFAREAGKGYWR